MVITVLRSSRNKTRMGRSLQSYLSCPFVMFSWTQNVCHQHPPSSTINMGLFIFIKEVDTKILIITTIIHTYLFIFSVYFMSFSFSAVEYVRMTHIAVYLSHFPQSSILFFHVPLPYYISCRQYFCIAIYCEFTLLELEDEGH